jgi:hypothetical protein
VVTDRDGRFRLRLLPGEAYSVVAQGAFR